MVMYKTLSSILSLKALGELKHAAQFEPAEEGETTFDARRFTSATLSWHFLWYRRGLFIDYIGVFYLHEWVKNKDRMAFHVSFHI